MALNLVQGKQIATASWAINALTASYLDGYTSPFPFTGSALITGSLGVTGSASILSGSLTINSVAATNALVLSGSTPNITFVNTGSSSSNSRIIVQDRAWGSKTNQSIFSLRLIGSGSYGGFDEGNPVGQITFSKSTNDRTDITLINSNNIANGGIFISSSGNMGIRTSTPTSASLQINGNVFADSYTGSLFGTASFATSASFAISSSRAVTSSFAISASWAPMRPGGSDTQIQFNSGSTLVGTGSFTFNYKSQSLQQGLAVTASGLYSHAEGLSTQAIGDYSHAEGESTRAIGDYSHAEGETTQAIETYSHAEGDSTITGIKTAFSNGKNAIVNGVITLSGEQITYFTPGGYLYVYDQSTKTSTTYLINTVTFDGTSTLIQLVDTSININAAAFGDITYLLNNGTFGSNSTIPGDFSHTEGKSTQAVGNYSHAEGNLTNALGDYSHTEGFDTLTQGSYSHAEGRETQAIGTGSHAEGRSTTASADYSHTEGFTTKTGTTTAFATSEKDGVGSGLVRIASTYGDVTAYFTPGNYLYLYDSEFSDVYGYASFLIDTVTWDGERTLIQLIDTSVTTATAYVGDLTYLKNNGTFGGNKTIPGDYSHAEGRETQAVGYSSHAEGNQTQASGPYSHAEGYITQAIGAYSHAEGQNTKAIGNYSHAEGFETIASGSDSHAEGESTQAIGASSHAEGNITKAIGDFSHAEGYLSIASGSYSHAEGEVSQALGMSSHAEGLYTIASGVYSHAEGDSTIASGSWSHAEGSGTQAIGDYSHAEGETTQAIGYASHAEGNQTIAAKDYSHAEGAYTNVTENYSHAEGYYNATVGLFSHAEGLGTVAAGIGSKTEGLGAPAYDPGTPFENIFDAYGLDVQDAVPDSLITLDTPITSLTTLTATGDYTSTVTYPYRVPNLVINFYIYGQPYTVVLESATYDGGTGLTTFTVSGLQQYFTSVVTDYTSYTLALGDYSHAEGESTKTYGKASHAEGYLTTTSGEFSHAEGFTTISSGSYSHAEGGYTQAIGYSSHAEGNSTQAIGANSHAEGNSTQAIGEGSHAEGFQTQASGIYSHAEGDSTQAIGYNSHAEGASTVASGYASHAEGFGSQAIADFSHAEGYATVASGSYQHVQGRFNITSSDQSAFIIGNGTGVGGSRSNLVFASGSTFQITGSLQVSGSITGSLFGTASYAINAATASNILGGSINHIPYFKTATTLATSSLYQSGSSTVIINQDNATTANPEALYVWQPSPTSFNVISGKGDINNYLQLNIQNTNQGANASSDVVATANNGNESTNYIDMGINSQNYNANFIGGINDAYVYSTGRHLHIGNASNFPVQIFAGGSDVDVHNKLELNPNNQHSMSGSLDVSGSVKAFSFTGSLQGNAATATTATSASHALIADNATNANYAATAGNGGVTSIVAGSGITLPFGGTGNVTVVASGGGGVTIISGSLVTGSFSNTNSYTFNHNLNTRTPTITVFDSNYNQIIPENISLDTTSSATITFPTLESGFAIGSTGGTTGTALSSSYSLFATYADSASYFPETDPIFVAKSGSLATTGSNTFRGNQTVTGSLRTSGSNTLIGSTSLTGSLSISGSTVQTGNNTLIGTTTLTGSILISGDVIPQVSSSFDLGSLTNPWRSIYVQSGSISVQSDIPGGIPAVISNANGNVTFAGAGFQLKSGSFVPFEISASARTIIRVPNVPANDIGGLSIIGSSNGSYQGVTNAGGLLHLTSNDGQSSRITSDAFGTAANAAYVGRKARGTAASPLPVQSGDVLTRISSIGWTGPEYGFTMSSSLTTAPTSIDVIALENYTTSSFGSRFNFYNVPSASTIRTLSAQIDTTGITIPSSSRLFGTASWATNAQTASYVRPLTQDVIITGSLTLSSGSALRINNGFYVDGQKQFNYGQFSSTQTQSGSADTAYSMTFNTTDFSNGVSLVSGSRLTIANTGIYNIQFSSQLHTTANQAVDFSIWFAMTGSNIANSNTDFTVEKISGGGYAVAALNFLTQIQSGSYIELKYSKTTLEGQLQAKGTQATPSRPATPSAIVTVTQIA